MFAHETLAPARKVAWVWGGGGTMARRMVPFPVPMLEVVAKAASAAVMAQLRLSPASVAMADLTAALALAVRCLFVPRTSIMER
jgi:hypothetical protein